MKYPDLHRKVIFASPTPNWGLDVGQGIYLHKTFFAMNKIKCPCLQRKVKFANLTSLLRLGGGLIPPENFNE